MVTNGRNRTSMIIEVGYGDKPFKNSTRLILVIFQQFINERDNNDLCMMIFGDQNIRK